MLLYYFQIYHIFVLCVNIQVNCGISQEHATIKTETLQPIKPGRKCQFDSCTPTERGKCKDVRCWCTDFPQWKGIQCIDDYGSAYHGFYYPTLLFRNIKYLSVKMFEGYRFHKFDLTLSDYYNVTFAENALEGILVLEQFEVKRSSIKVIPDFRFVRNSISSIAIDSSCLTSLEGKHLQGLTVLLSLSFVNNSIKYIDKDVFKGTENVQGLYLSYNLLTSIPPKLLDSMKNLQTFSVSYNNLLHIDKLFTITNPLTLQEEELPGLTQLYSLYLNNNQIKSLGPLRQLRNLKVLNIAHNDIALIKVEQLPWSLSEIYLAGNPFRCNCCLGPLFNLLNEKEKNGHLKLDTDMCLRSNFRTRLRQQPTCPDMCSCRCSKYEDVSYMFVDCSSGNLSEFPQFLSKNLTMLNVDRKNTSGDERIVTLPNSHNSVYLKDKVLGLNLENNSLEFLDATQLPSHLIELYLSNNKLRWLPDSIFDEQLDLKRVSLSGNSWICDCSTLKFKEWLTSKLHIFIDFDNIRCGISDEGKGNLNGSVIWKLNDIDLCPGTEEGQILSVSIGILSLITFFLAAVLIYKTYELNIKVFLYYHGITFVKEAVLDQDKDFDAFVSFSHKDDEFVIKEIIAEIEKRDPNIRLCLHYRHFVPGEFISDNIARAVKNSKRTVLILSSNFLESEWCFLEFQTAHLQTLQDKVHRIIVVTVGELPEDIDPTIEVYLNSTTYMTWGERNFWNKLLFILPSGINVNNPVPRNGGGNEIAFNFPLCDV